MTPMFHVDPLIERVGGLRPAADEAEIALLVLRLPGEGRVTPARIVLDPVVGVVGDRWSMAREPNLDAQVTLMRWDVASLLHATPAILGDNLFASIDTSAANLPPGTRVRVGGALCVVTPKPHRGCARFAARAGAHALALTRARGAEQLRGVHLRVLEGGEVGLGDRLRVESRG